MILAHEDEVTARVQAPVSNRLPEGEGGVHEPGLRGNSSMVLDLVNGLLTY
jgi:hypothetical protein